MAEILNAMKSYSLALLDYCNGWEDAEFAVRRENGFTRTIKDRVYIYDFFAFCQEVFLPF